MDNEETRRQYQILQFLFIILLGGQLLLLFFVWLVIRGRQSWYNPAYEGNILYLLLPVVLLGTLAGIFLMGRVRGARKKSIRDPRKAMDHYRETVLFQLALLEGANIFALAVTAISLSTYPLAYFAAGLLVFLGLFPRN